MWKTYHVVNPKIMIAVPVQQTCLSCISMSTATSLLTKWWQRINESQHSGNESSCCIVAFCTIFNTIEQIWHDWYKTQLLQWSSKYIWIIAVMLNVNRLVSLSIANCSLFYIIVEACYLTATVFLFMSRQGDTTKWRIQFYCLYFYI